jgi:acyl-CoA dehydrogenase
MDKLDDWEKEGMVGREIWSWDLGLLCIDMPEMEAEDLIFI